MRFLYLPPSTRFFLLYFFTGCLTSVISGYSSVGSDIAIIKCKSVNYPLGGPTFFRWCSPGLTKLRSYSRSTILYLSSIQYYETIYECASERSLNLDRLCSHYEKTGGDLHFFSIKALVTNGRTTRRSPAWILLVLLYY